MNFKRLVGILKTKNLTRIASYFFAKDFQPCSSFISCV